MVTNVIHVCCELSIKDAPDMFHWIKIKQSSWLLVEHGFYPVEYLWSGHCRHIRVTDRDYHETIIWSVFAAEA